MEQLCPPALPAALPTLDVPGNLQGVITEIVTAALCDPLERSCSRNRSRRAAAAPRTATPPTGPSEQRESGGSRTTPMTNIPRRSQATAEPAAFLLARLDEQEEPRHGRRQREAPADIESKRSIIEHRAHHAPNLRGGRTRRAARAANVGAGLHGSASVVSQAYAGTPSRSSSLSPGMDSSTADQP